MFGAVLGPSGLTGAALGAAATVVLAAARARVPGRRSGVLVVLEGAIVAGWVLELLLGVVLVGTLPPPMAWLARLVLPVAAIALAALAQAGPPCARRRSPRSSLRRRPCAGRPHEPPRRPAAGPGRRPARPWRRGHGRGRQPDVRRRRRPPPGAAGVRGRAAAWVGIARLAERDVRVARAIADGYRRLPATSASSRGSWPAPHCPRGADAGPRARHAGPAPRVPRRRGDPRDRAPRPAPRAAAGGGGRSSGWAGRSWPTSARCSAARRPTRPRSRCRAWSCSPSPWSWRRAAPSPAGCPRGRRRSWASRCCSSFGAWVGAFRAATPAETGMCRHRPPWRPAMTTGWRPRRAR